MSRELVFSDLPHRSAGQIRIFFLKGGGFWTIDNYKIAAYSALYWRAGSRRKEYERKRPYDFSGVSGTAAGLFHDLLEDTDATEEEILSLGGEQVLRCVKALTKTHGYVMAEYVAAIKADPMARRVKAADRLHNLRCALVAGEDFKRKYVLETVDWYLDLCPEIPAAVKALAESMTTPLPQLSLEYRPVDNWLKSENE